MKFRLTSSGFSLIELLVVIFIVAVLIALLVPAVQAARESARRAQCRNNLKQIGIALHNYHDSYGTLPIGARRQTGVGPSWWVAILPYVEQSALFDSFDQKINNNGMNPANPALDGRATIPFAICPSSSMPTKSAGNPSLAPQMITCYSGMAGAAKDLSGQFDDGSFDETRVSACCAGMSPTSQGLFSSGGMLIANSAIRFSDASDGLSNTIIVGEMNGIVVRTNGTKSEMEASNTAGWAAGTSSVGYGKQFRTSFGTVAASANNISTLLYPVNFSINNSTIYKGIQPGGGPNNPLLSFHDGGANVLLTDGSAKFISDSTALSILKRLATRDDGQTISEF
jgi:prepilin-type N-terminal cleavage/methylation domain